MTMQFDAIDLFGSHETFRPSLDAMLNRWEQNFTHRHEPKSNPVRELHVELLLSPEQAVQGGSVPIEVPVARVCPRCEGSGVTGFYDCDLCDGHGTEWRAARVNVRLVPPVRDDGVVDVPLRHLGVRNFVLRCHVRVAH